MNNETSWLRRLRKLVIGGARSPHDPRVFHKISLIAFFAWVGLGADGLSSSCYGPPEAFLALKAHPTFAIFIGIATALTVIIISASYSQIIELFPSGGGGYLAASKLLSPGTGMIAGCALLVDYVLTITLSIASATDAVFSFLPLEWLPYKLVVALIGVLVLTLMNLRGVREAVLPLVPIFLVFVFTHAFAIIYALASHAGEVPALASSTGADVRYVITNEGFLALMLILLNSYSMGAGTYTGIEAVSNAVPILREPRVKTAKRTMVYMAGSLAFMAMGLMLAYLLYNVTQQAGSHKTLNAVLFENLTANWGSGPSKTFVFITLLSEGAILYVAAQTGFLGGPRVLANMGLDRWVPTRFAMLSDRLVTHDGVLLMGGAAVILMASTGASVHYLVVLYSINVFITFLLSQLGMVRHWWGERRNALAKWKHRLLINGVGLALTVLILVSVVVIKFHDGGWITLLITGALAILAILIRRHYANTGVLLRRLDTAARLVESAISPSSREGAAAQQEYRPQEATAVILVSGYNGVGIHTLAGVMRIFGNTFRNYVFVQVGAVDAGNFKGQAEMERLRTHTQSELDRYVKVMRDKGYYAESFHAVGTDVADEVMALAPQIRKRFPNAVFFGGQLVFQQQSFLTSWLHNNLVFALQRRFYFEGLPFIIMPIRV